MFKTILFTASAVSAIKLASTDATAIAEVTPETPSQLRGVNYGNIFIPEHFYAKKQFYKRNNIPKVHDHFSLCDLTGENSSDAMADWLDKMIKEQDFEEMHALGINFLRLPLGYWNVIDMTEDPEAPADEASRMGNLSKIMNSSKDYQKYIQRILDLAQTYNIKVMLDLHGAPGNQGGTGHAGCYTNKIPYWDTDKNKEWTTKAVVAVAEICKNAGDVCYGVELLNEPAFDLDRVHLREWYQTALKEVRGQGLAMDKPLVIMEWMPMWTKLVGNTKGRWEKHFPAAEFGTTQLDTHIYDFYDTIEETKAGWESKWKKATKISAEVPLMLGEYTLALNKKYPMSEAQGWATYLLEESRKSNMIGTALWTWAAPQKYWSMRGMSNLENDDGIDWPKAFHDSEIDEQ